MWINENLDVNLKKYLTMCGINPDEVKSVYAFGIGYDYDFDYDPVDIPRPVERRVFTFYDLKPEYENYYLEYNRILVVFKNGLTDSWDIVPTDWFRLWKKINKEEETENA